MMNCLILVIISVINIKVCGWESLNASLTANLFGNCPFTIIDNSNNIDSNSFVANHFYVERLYPSGEEIKDYNTIPSMLTRSNSKLGEGIVRGVSTADEWANRTTNSWQLAPDHPRNNKKLCVKLSRLTGIKDTAVEIYDKYKINVDDYIIHAKNALLHDSGTVSISCGYFQPIEGCETIFKFIGRKWHSKCKNTFRKHTPERIWPITLPNNKQLGIFNTTMCKDNSLQSFQYYKEVFVITASWDNNYHHFIIDLLSRLVRHINYLNNNKHIKIHIRKFEQYAKKERYIQGGIDLRKRLIQLLGFDLDRFVAGPVYAERVHIPRAVKCNYPIASAYNIRLLSNYMKKQANIQNSNSEVHSLMRALLQPLQRNHKRLVIQHRPCNTNVDCDKTWREWNGSVAQNFYRGFKRQFFQHQVTLLNSGDPRWNDCFSCQIELYAQTDVLVGLHGAGLTNIIFMPPGSLVVEIIGQFDGRMMPLCGYHGSLAAIFGVHHYLYYYDWRGGEVPNPAIIAEEAFNYHRFLNK